MTYKEAKENLGKRVIYQLPDMFLTGKLLRIVYPIKDYNLDGTRRNEIEPTKAYIERKVGFADRPSDWDNMVLNIKDLELL